MCEVFTGNRSLKSRFETALAYVPKLVCQLSAIVLDTYRCGADDSDVLLAGGHDHLARQVLRDALGNDGHTANLHRQR